MFKLVAIPLRGRLMKRSLAYLLLLALSGCGAIQSYQNGKRLAEARADYDANEASCRQRFPEPSPMAPRIKCLAEAKNAFAERIGSNPDLVRQMSARIVALAEKTDAGKVSPSEFDVEKANIAVSYETQVRQRGNEAAMADAAVMSAYAANRSRSCTKYGNTVNCY